MSFDALKDEVQTLPLELQNNIEMYALFVIDQFRKSSQKPERKQTAAEIIHGLTGIIKTDVPLTMMDIRAERISGKYGE